MDTAPDTGHQPPSDAGESYRRVSPRALRRLYALLVLFGCVAFTATFACWVLLRRARKAPLSGLVPDQIINPAAASHPGVDFTSLYPGFSPAEIDLIQRQTNGVPLLYAPYTELRMGPVRSTYVNVSDHGFRFGRTEPPWPPPEENFSVFCFGGSTTFGYGVPDASTFPAALEEVLQERMPDRRVVCYNFGCGFFQSTQERILFEQILLNGGKPDAAVFLDGVNDFYFPDGGTKGEPVFFNVLTPRLAQPAPLDTSTPEGKRTTTALTLSRLKGNYDLIRLSAAALGIQTLFLGQPVPFHSFNKDPRLYPFTNPYPGHELCSWAYPRFEHFARSGSLGANFIWVGDAFEKADKPMYVDSVHYSREGSLQLARVVVERAMEKKLIQ